MHVLYRVWLTLTTGGPINPFALDSRRRHSQIVAQVLSAADGHAFSLDRRGPGSRLFRLVDSGPEWKDDRFASGQCPCDSSFAPYPGGG
jgi:hypothetical protein